MNTDINIDLTSPESKKVYTRNALVLLATDLGNHTEMHPSHIGEIVAEMLVSSRRKMINILRREFPNCVTLLSR